MSRKHWYIQALIAFFFWVSALQSAVVPVISDFTPRSGTPGTSVIITGRNFLEVQAVEFNGLPAVITILSATQIAATVPLNATTGPIKAIAPGGSSVTSASFVVAPRITGFVPGSGSPGTMVVVSGANFTGATSVKFGDHQAAFTVTAPTQISATVPPNSKSGPITVVTPAGTAASAASFAVLGSGPVITGFVPELASPGSPITIHGVNFTGARTVSFNGTASSFTVTAPTQIRATVPASATSGPIAVVTSLGATTSAAPFLVAGQAPHLSGFSPVQGTTGTVVIISGINFLGTTNVFFNGKAAVFAVTAPTQISATVPFGATSGAIKVASLTGQSISSRPFSVLGPQPYITSFSPSSGAAGTTVTIEGGNFSAVTAVKFNGVNAAFTVTASSQIQATVPVGATSGPIQITNASGNGSSGGSFTVLGSGPIITEFQPPAGLPRDQVIIRGLNFLGATNVAFNGAASSFSVVSPTQINAQVPTNASTGPIRVSTPFGAYLTSNLFYLPPQLVSFSPSAGFPDMTISIRGSNFLGANQVRFGPSDAQFRVAGNDLIEAVVPRLAASSTISVATPAGIVASTNIFQVVPVSVILPDAVRTLSITRVSSAQAVVSWPTSAVTLRLEAKSDVQSPWTPVTPARVAGQFRFTNDLAGTLRIFRLAFP